MDRSFLRNRKMEACSEEWNNAYGAPLASRAIRAAAAMKKL